MAVHFQVLGSGSSGNASLLDVDGFGVLVDLGFGPRQLAARVLDGEPLWERVRAALLTHVHGDHWNENTLRTLLRRQIPLYCHPEHAAFLDQASSAFGDLGAADLVHEYTVDVGIPVGPACRCTPLPLSHDGGTTCGFRFESAANGAGPAWALAYAADLGSWDRRVARRLANVDVLAIEFNHDVAMQLGSGRSPHHIRRVLGDHGHLSNRQAAALFAEVLRRSEPGRLRHLVQLHLSRECNRPELAQHAAREVVQRTLASVEVHTTSQDVAGQRIVVESNRRSYPWQRECLAVTSMTLFADWE
jgi:phosphoribosyl 1,2-cyclic phosphodiesterase